MQSNIFSLQTNFKAWYFCAEMLTVKLSIVITSRSLSTSAFDEIFHSDGRKFKAIFTTKQNSLPNRLCPVTSILSVELDNDYTIANFLFVIKPVALVIVNFVVNLFFSFVLAIFVTNSQIWHMFIANEWINNRLLTITIERLISFYLLIALKNYLAVYRFSELISLLLNYTQTLRSFLLPFTFMSCV